MTLVDEMPSKDLIYDQLLLLIIFTRDFFFLSDYQNSLFIMISIKVLID